MMHSIYTSTSCRCGWKPTNQTDEMAACDEVNAHHARHMDGRLPDYETYPPMPPIEQPEDKVRRLARALLVWVEEQRDSLKQSADDCRGTKRGEELGGRVRVLNSVLQHARALREALESQ